MSNKHDNIENLEKHLANDARRATHDLAHPIFGTRTGQQEHAYGAVGLQIGGRLLAQILHSIGRVLPHENGHPVWTDPISGEKTVIPPFDDIRSAESKEEVDKIRELVENILGYSPALKDEERTDAQAALEDNLQRIARGSAGGGENEDADEINPLEIFKEVEAFYNKQGNSKLAGKAKAARLSYMDAKKEKTTGRPLGDDEKTKLTQLNDQLSNEARGQAAQAQSYRPPNVPGGVPNGGGGAGGGAGSPAGGLPAGGGGAPAQAPQRQQPAPRPQTVPTPTDEQLAQTHQRAVEQAQQRVKARESQLARLQSEGVPADDPRMQDAQANVQGARDNLAYAQRQQQSAATAGPRRGPAPQQKPSRPPQATAGTTEASRAAELERADEDLRRIREQQAIRRGEASPEDVEEARAQRASDRVMRIAERLGFSRPARPAPDSTPTTPQAPVDGEAPKFDKNQDLAAALARSYNSVASRRQAEGQTAGRAEAAGANLGELRQQLHELDDFDLADMAAQAAARGEVLSPEDLLIQEEVTREANRARFEGAGSSRRRERVEAERDQAVATRRELSRRFEEFAETQQAFLDEQGEHLPPNSPLRRELEKEIEGARNASKVARFEALLARSDLAPEVKEGIQEQVNRLKRQGIYSAHQDAENLVSEIQGRPREKDNFRPTMQEQLYVALGRREIPNREIEKIHAFSGQFTAPEKGIRDSLNSEIDARAKKNLKVPAGSTAEETWDSLQSNENQTALTTLRRKAASEVARDLYDNYRKAIDEFNETESPEAMQRAAGYARGLLLSNKKIRESYDASPKVYKDARRQIGQDAEASRRDSRAAAAIMELGGTEADSGGTEREEQAREDRVRRARAAEGDEGSATDFYQSAKERLQVLSGLGRGSSVSNNDVYDLYHNYIRGMSDTSIPKETRDLLRSRTSEALDHIFEDKDIGNGINPRKVAQQEFEDGIFRAARLRNQGNVRTLQGGGSARVNAFFRQGRNESPTLEIPDTVRSDIFGSIDRIMQSKGDFVQNQVFGAPAMRQPNGTVKRLRLTGEDTEIPQNQLKASDVERYLVSQGINSAKIQVIPNSKDPDGTAVRNNIGPEGESAPSLDVTVYDDPTDGQFIEGLKNLSTVQNVSDIDAPTGRLIYEGNQFLIGQQAVERIADQLREQGFRNLSIQTAKKIDPSRSKASKRSEIPTVPTLEISHSYGPEETARLEQALKNIRYASGKGPVGGKVVPERQDLRAPGKTVSIATSDPEIASRVNGILLSSNIRNAYVRNQRSIFDTTEPSIEVELLDDVDDAKFESILDSLGRQLPGELSFGLGDEGVWLNPHNPALKDRSPLYANRLLDNLQEHLSQGTLHPADARILSEDVLPGLQKDLAVEGRIAAKRGNTEEAEDIKRLSQELQNIQNGLTGAIRQSDEATGFVQMPNPEDFEGFNAARYSRARAEKGLSDFAENLRRSLIESGDFSRLDDRAVRGKIQQALTGELNRLDTESPLKMTDIERNTLIAHARRIATADRSSVGRLNSEENRKRVRARVERLFPKAASILEEMYRDPEAFRVPKRITDKIKDGQYLTGDEHEQMARIAMRRANIGEVIPTGPAIGQVFNLKRNGEEMSVQVVGLDTGGGVPTRLVTVTDPNASPFIPLGVSPWKGKGGPEVDLYEDVKSKLQAPREFALKNFDTRADLETPEGRQEIADQFNKVYHEFTTQRIDGMHPRPKNVLVQALNEAGGPMTADDVKELGALTPQDLRESLLSQFKARVALPLTRVAHTKKKPNPDYEFTIDMSDDRGFDERGMPVGANLLPESLIPEFTGDTNFQSPTKTQEEDMNLNTPWDAQEDVPGGAPSRFDESLNIGKEIRLTDGRTVQVTDDQRKMETAEAILRPVEVMPDGTTIPTGDPDESRSIDSNMFSQLVYERPISPDAMKAFDIRTSPEEVISEAVRYSQLVDANRLSSLTPQERLSGYKNNVRKLNRPPKIGISGSRDGVDKQQVVDFINSLPPGSTVVHGGARGVDRWADEAARARGLNVEVKKPQIDPADVQRMGERAAFARAAFKRNGDIVRASDALFAFHANNSRGTADAISRAVKSDTPYHVFTPDSDVTDITNDLEGNMHLMGLDISSYTSPDGLKVDGALNSGTGFDPRSQAEAEMPEIIRERVIAAFSRGDEAKVVAAVKKNVEDGDLTRVRDILQAVPVDERKAFLSRVLSGLAHDPASDIERIRAFVSGINPEARAEILNEEDAAGISTLERLRRKASGIETPSAAELTDPTPADNAQTAEDVLEPEQLAQVNAPAAPTVPASAQSVDPALLERAKAVADKIKQTFAGEAESYLPELRAATRENDNEAITGWEDFFSTAERIEAKKPRALEALRQKIDNTESVKDKQPLQQQLAELERDTVQGQDLGGLMSVENELDSILETPSREEAPGQTSMFDGDTGIIPVGQENFNKVVESKTAELKQAILSGDTEKAKRLMEELGSTCISPDE